jgi:hypothetical protein
MLASLVAGWVRVIAASSRVVVGARCCCTDRCSTHCCGTDTSGYAGTPTSAVDSTAINSTAIGATVIGAGDTTATHTGSSSMKGSGMESAGAAAARQGVTGDTRNAKCDGCGNDEDGAILHGDFLSRNPPSNS